MQLSKCAVIALAGVGFAVSATSVFASVNLAISKQNSLGTASVSVPAGQSFDITITLQTTAGEQVSAVDYFLKSTLGLASANNIFTVSSQDLSNSVFVDTEGGVFPSTLSPTSTDLGAGEVNVSNSVSGAASRIGDFHILVAGNAVPGSTYNLTIADDASHQLSYTGPSPDFASGSINGLGTFAVTVTAPVPEPMLAAVLPAIGGAMALRRRRGA